MWRRAKARRVNADCSETLEPAALASDLTYAAAGSPSLPYASKQSGTKRAPWAVAWPTQLSSFRESPLAAAWPGEVAARLQSPALFGVQVRTSNQISSEPGVAKMTASAADRAIRYTS